MSNITVTHSESGLVHAHVVRSARISPHVVRVTLGGPDLATFVSLGFDQWVRLALPVRDETRLDNLPKRFGVGGFLRYLTLPKGTRPVIRNYTIRSAHRDPDELDIDFVVHGEQGIAGPWASTVAEGTEVAFIDQGCGWRPTPAEWNLLVCDESGMPAVLGILRDMPRTATGVAFIEIFDAADRQEAEAPSGMDVRWLVRDPAAAPGALALPSVEALDVPTGSPYAFAVGEQALATGIRRHLVQDRGLPKPNVTFSGYWRIGRASPS